MEESTFVTPSKYPKTQMLPFSGSYSPFTPKTSKIVRKRYRDLNSVSRSLSFDDSNSKPFNGNLLSFSSLSQPVIRECERIDSERTTPTKTQQLFLKKNENTLSPYIKNCLNQFNTVQQENNSVNQSHSKNCDSNNSIPYKKFKTSSDIANCSSSQLIQKPLNFVSDKDDENTSQIDIYYNKEESLFKTPSKFNMFQMLPSSGSLSPFTPKKSKIKWKNDENLNSVSRTLIFDNSNSINLTFNDELECLPLNQQVSNEYEQTDSEQTTPVKTQQTFVKNNNKILLSPNIKKYPNRFNVVQQEINTINQSPRKRNGSNNSTPSKKLGDVPTCNQITYHFKSSQKPSNYLSDEYKKNISQIENSIKSEFSTDSVVSDRLETFNSLESIQNKSLKKNCAIIQVKYNKNKNIQSSKNFDTNMSLKKEKKNSPRKKATDNPLSNKNIIEQTHIVEPITPSKNKNILTMKIPSIDFLKNIIISGGDTYSRFIKTIVLKPELLCIGNSDIIKTIFNSTDDELKIYGRLISRKHRWIRSNESYGLNKYKELNLCDNFDGVLTSLATKQLIVTDVTSCKLDCLLNMLKSHELKELQKSFKINSKSNKNMTKPEMIKSFINFVKNQTTISGKTMNDNLKNCIKKKLGYCLKISDESRDDIRSCLIYESYPYFIGDEKDRFHDCFMKFSLVEKMELKFPTFETKQVSINFNTKNCLEKYKIALNLRCEVQLSLEQKNHKNAIILLNEMFENLKSAVCDKSLIDSLSKIPTYMRKYSAVSVYAYTLFKNISILNKMDLKKEVLEFLLKHKEFLMSKRANLHIELAKVLESQYKQLDNAAKVLIDGLKDDTLNELEYQMLSNRAIIYANRKARKMNSELKKELLSLTTVLKELPSIEIGGKIVPKEKFSSGHKQVYSKKTENGDILWMSVEELALSHYNNQGYLYGFHDEGQFIKSMFLLCFWDIIYDTYGDYILFISQYQDCPLDWRTHHFYKIREKKIKDRIAELKQLNVDQICDILKERCDLYYNIQSVINWKFMDVNNLSQCRMLLKCLGNEVFLMIGEQILKDGRNYLYGMPDLIVWDAIKLKCMFVEVKGPNDKLSDRQYSWLHKLIEFGANVEVCHVVGTGGKNITNNNMD